MLDLEAIKERCGAATPGEWSDYGWQLEGEDWGWLGEIHRQENMDFIIHAHNTDIPALITEVERLRYDYAEAMRQYDEAQRRVYEAEAEVRQLKELRGRALSTIDSFSNGEDALHLVAEILTETEREYAGIA